MLMAATRTGADFMVPETEYVAAGVIRISTRPKVPLAILGAF